MIFEYIVGFAVFVLIFLIIVLFFMLLNEKQNRENDETELKNKIKKSHEKLLKGQDNTKKELNESIEYNKKMLFSSIDCVTKEFNNKTDLLKNDIERIRTENAELKRKIEFFTEIREDSKNLNESDNIKNREALIDSALKEINALLTDEKVNSESHVLDSEQLAALTTIETTNKNLFVTGKAGTGKSFVLEVFKRTTSKTFIVVAYTGIAALNVGGATIHSTFGYNNLEKIPIEALTIDKIRNNLNSNKILVLKEIDTLIIDEISMVRSDYFAKIDVILKEINNNNKPFGGKQILIFGDLFQLPPIAKGKVLEKFLQDNFGGLFFFNTSAYKEANFDFIELSINHRQNGDNQFFEILNRVREGKQSSTDISVLNSRLVNSKTDLRRVITLFSTKAAATKLNEQELAKIVTEIGTKEYTYNAKIIFNATPNQTPLLESIFPISEKLHIQVGALVMMVANDPEKRWVNGTMGVVDSLDENGIRVAIDGIVYDVYKTEFTEQEAVFAGGKIIFKDILTVEQYPLVLAYAITIHKSQGMTYKRLACDISKSFASGQAYVALSRCSSLNGLYLLSEVHNSDIKVNSEVVEFYNSQKDKNKLN